MVHFQIKVINAIRYDHQSNLLKLRLLFSQFYQSLIKNKHFHTSYFFQSAYANFIRISAIAERQQYGKNNKIYKSVNRSSMSLNIQRSRELSLQQSRVSSSSSNSSEAYELIPREQPFFKPARDIASPKASFPFRKVQAGNESAMGGKSINDSRSSIKSSVKDQKQAKEIIEGFAQYSATLRETQRGRQTIKNVDLHLHEDCRGKILQAQQRIEQLQKRLEEERYEFQFQRKANEIYTDGFAKIRELILARSKHLQGESIEQMVQVLAEMLQPKPGIDPGHAYHIIQQQDRKIRELRAQLLKSTQNNINAIFNTQITQAYLLQSQIQKMNQQILNLKQKLVKATTENQQNIAKILQSNSNSTQVKKIIKYYKLNWDSESQGEQIGKEAVRIRKKSKQANLRDSRQRSSSQKNTRNMLKTQTQLNDMIQGFQSLKEQYKLLVTFLSQINSSQTDFKQSFTTMKKDITFVLQNQIKDIKETVNRPSSSHEQLRIARQLLQKLNDLVNTLNAPQKVNIERQIEDEQSNNWKFSETTRKLIELESRYMELEEEYKRVVEERDHLKQILMRINSNKPPPLHSDT